jgi:NAD(P)-dependent dehydrogenase (short-subunit alcohol dehydrogenase family)
LIFLGWLEGKVALITGGGSGIGRGVVEAFIEEGARVSVLEINESKAENLSKEFGGKLAVIRGDATKLEDNEKTVTEAVSKFGKLDILVCCPALFDSFKSLDDLPGEKISPAFDEIFAVNVKSYILSTKATLRELLKTGGSVVYTVSNAGFYPAGGGPLYTATKFAVRGLVLQMAYELAPKVRVNGVAPGGTVTDLRGLKTLGERDKSVSDSPGLADVIKATGPLQIVPDPKDHAWAYVYLASKNRSRAVTGTIIHSDCGLGVRGLTKLAGMIP